MTTGTRRHCHAEERWRPDNKDWARAARHLEKSFRVVTGAAKAVGVVIPELNKKLRRPSRSVDVSVVVLDRRMTSLPLWPKSRLR